MCRKIKIKVVFRNCSRVLTHEDSEYKQKFVTDVSTQVTLLINQLCIDAARTQGQIKQLALNVLGYCLFQKDFTK